MPPDRFAKIRNEHFQERIARMKKLVGTGSFSAEQKQAFERFFARLEVVRELRNRIAHGHLLVRITKLGETPVITLSLPKDLDTANAPETQHLEFEELTKAQSELAALIEDFQKLTDDWSSETSPVEGICGAEDNAEYGSQACRHGFALPDWVTRAGEPL